LGFIFRKNERKINGRWYGKIHDLGLGIKGSMSFLFRLASTFVNANEWVSRNFILNWPTNLNL
jgi:hypothetical protein